jgi:hypothetical protein
MTMITGARYSQSGAILAEIDGTIVTVPDDMANGDRRAIAAWIADGNAITAYVPPAPIGSDVDAERDRRIALGVAVTLADSSSFTVQTRDERDFRNVAGLSTAALAYKALGQSPTIVFRDAANVNHNLTPDLVIEMGLKVAAATESIYARSWALKAISPIPADCTSDTYWT